MGWTTCDSTTRRETWRRVLGTPWENAEGKPVRCGEPRIVGDCFWAVLYTDDAPTCIVLALIQGPRDPDAVGSVSEKTMTECEGPHYYNCPVDLLDQVPEPEAGSYAAEWRAKVRRAAKAGVR